MNRTRVVSMGAFLSNAQNLCVRPHVLLGVALLDRSRQGGGVAGSDLDGILSGPSICGCDTMIRSLVVRASIGGVASQTSARPRGSMSRAAADFDRGVGFCFVWF